MFSAADYEGLIRENAHLKTQLEELEIVLKLREEELALVHQQNEELLQQKILSEQLSLELTQLQEKLSEAESQLRADKLIWKDLERENIAAIALEKEYQHVLEQVKVLESKSELAQMELEDAWKIMPEIDRLSQQLPEIQSRLELTELDRDMIKEDLEICRAEKWADGELSAKGEA